MLNNNAQISNVLLIGVGPHAKKVYAPWIHLNRHVAKLAATVELETARRQTRLYFDSLGEGPQLLFTKQFSDSKLPKELETALNKAVEKYNINSVIIATEPGAHKAYAIWALNKNLNIIMDKPITAVPMAALRPKAAKQLLIDFYDIKRAYTEALSRNPHLIFIVNAQRRFHPGFDEVFRLIEEVALNTGCPVTSTQSSHADGQWRLPDEIIDIEYHGYSHGYGKASHSGYHTFDLLAQIIKLGIPIEKRPDSLEAVATSVFPSDYFSQVTPADYSGLFKDANFSLKRSEAELRQNTKNFGEIDQFSMLNFKRNNATICTSQISLLHNSFSERSWVVANSDLYKGNGRVKHEHHFIQQGPLQTIHIQSYQHFTTESNADDLSTIGSARHFDMHIFRNNRIIGGKRYEKLTFSNCSSNEQTNDFRLDELKSKGLVLSSFFGYLSGNLPKNGLKSQFEDHENSVIIMSTVYLAQIQNLKVRHDLKEL